MTVPARRDTSLAHATLKAKGGDALTLTYNPSTLTVSKSARWEQTMSGRSGAPHLQYVGGEHRSLRLQAFFDARLGGEGSVARALDTLFGWLAPTADSVRRHAPSPPVVTFTWGKQVWFDACLREVRARYTMFDPDGVPTRAYADLALQEVPVAPARQNPTSGGPPGRRSRQLVAGDSLASLAHQEYGDPTRWRELAVANGLDDPMAVRPGDVLLVPPGSEREPA